MLRILILVVGSALAMQAARAETSILVDAQTGLVLAEERAGQAWYPASLTKLMTAYVAFRALQAGEITLQSPVKMTRNAASKPPAKMGYKPGAVMTFDNALKMLLVKSANDIAIAVGENISGSEEAFVARMNAEAARLGMTGSHFANPNGLHSERNYSTARDLAVLALAIRREFPEKAGYFNIGAITDGKRVMETYNQLLGRFDGADGMKTGFVCSSGFNMVGSATRNGRTLIAVVLGAKSGAARTDKAADMLAAGFAKPADAGIGIAALTAAAGTAPDMREIICPKAQPQASEKGTAKEAKDAKQTEKKPKFLSPHLREEADPFVPVKVGLGGAIGEPLAITEPLRRIPIPTPRPDYPVPAAKAASASGLKPALAQ